MIHEMVVRPLPASRTPLICRYYQMSENPGEETYQSTTDAINTHSLFLEEQGNREISGRSKRKRQR